MKTALGDITRAMGTAIAPVFLISGVGALLAAMSSRYGRVIDRAREILKEAGTGIQDQARRERTENELRRLYHRARLLRLTIILAAVSIFFVAVTIFVIFSTMILDLTLPYVVAVLFVAALILLIASLVFFIEDFAISLRGIKYEINSRLKHEVVDEA